MPFAAKKEIKMQLEQQRAFEINTRLCSTLEIQLTKVELVAQNHRACAKHAHKSKGVSKSVTLDRLRKYKTESAKAELLRRKLNNARTMLDAIEGAELTRQIFESASVTSEFTKKYTLNPEKASQIMEAVSEAQDGARETQDVLGEMIPGGTDASLLDDAALMHELDTWLEEGNEGSNDDGLEEIQLASSDTEDRNARAIQPLSPTKARGKNQASLAMSDVDDFEDTNALGDINTTKTSRFKAKLQGTLKYKKLSTQSKENPNDDIPLLQEKEQSSPISENEGTYVTHL